MVTFYFKYSLISYLKKIPRVLSTKVKKNSSTKTIDFSHVANKWQRKRMKIIITILFLMAMKWQRKLRINGEESYSRHNGISPLTLLKQPIENTNYEKSFTSYGNKSYQLHGKIFKEFLLIKANITYWKSLEDECVASLWEHKNALQKPTHFLFGSKLIIIHWIHSF